MIGKAFYDTDHAGSDTRSNHRGQSLVAVWEIHPVMELRIGNRTIAANGLPAATAVPTAEVAPTPVSPPANTQSSAQQFVTITRPVTITIPYGTTVLQRGMRLPVASRDASTVTVRYMNETTTLPIASTDLR